MFWPIYEWLWPLFQPCVDARLPIAYQAPVRVADAWGNLIFDSGAPLDLSVCLCPTPIMQVLLLLAAIGALACVVALVRLFMAPLVRETQTAGPPPAAQPSADEIIAQLRTVSDEYLRQALSR